MFKIENKSDLNKISLTGARALSILGLLTKSPHSLEEIKNIFIENGITEKDSSDDIVRIDVNTLKHIGCEISRPSVSNKYKYVLNKNPFALKLNQTDIDILKKAYNKIKSTISIEKLVKYDIFFRKLANNITDTKTKDQILGISVLKFINTEILTSLLNDCAEKNIITLSYEAPARKTCLKKSIIADNIIFRNDKIYILGFEQNSKESSMLNIERIKKILSREHQNDKDFEKNNIIVRFKLKSFGVAGMDETEKIISATDDGYIIEGKYHNEFLAIQRLLSFGADCTVLEPEKIRQEIINKLLSIREIYND